MRHHSEWWQEMERITPRTPRGDFGAEFSMAENGPENSPRLTALRGVCGECFGIRFVPVHGIGVPSRGVRGVVRRSILGICHLRGELRGEFAGSSKQLPAGSNSLQKRVFGIFAARQLPAHFPPIVERISQLSRGVRGVFSTPTHTRACAYARARARVIRKPGKLPATPRTPREAFYDAGFRRGELRGECVSTPATPRGAWRPTADR